MATFPYFVISPNTVISLIGLLRGKDKTVPTPSEDWREAVVDVLLPAYQEEHNIALALASLTRQTMKPHRIVIIDDGSSDRTIEFATKFCEENKLNFQAIRRKESIGKTPTLKRASRELDGDVQFILDSDTILESDNYIARTVEELYKAVGIASACGTILPLRYRDRRAMAKTKSFQNFLAKVPDAPITPPINTLRRMMRGLSNLYRDVLYTFLQKFLYVGQMAFFGSIVNPVGCAVAYRRKYIEDLFNHYEPILGDDLTNSEDVFIGFALIHKGYRNIQLTDVVARSEEPEAQNLPKQIYLWSSSFLQSCYYFDFLVRTPGKAFKLRKDRPSKEEQKEIEEKRKIKEPYRQRFGHEQTIRYGRPMGWAIFTSLVEKIVFPLVLGAFIFFQMWETLLWTVVIESAVAIFLLAIAARRKWFIYIFKGILLAPFRYIVALYDFFIILRFAADIWIFRNKKWRK